MIPEFSLDGNTIPPRELTSEENKRLKILMSRYVGLEEHLRLEALLLQRMKQYKAELQEMLKTLSAHWTYEDHVYRFYHGSWKVYGAQRTIEKAVELLRKLLPERDLNVMFDVILKEGTGKQFKDNKDWEKETRPILEAFFHSKFMIEMAMRYADLPKPPQPMPSGWAALLYLYDLR